MADDPRRDDNDPDEEGRRDESNPLEDLFRQLGMPTGPGQGGQPDLNALMQQLQQAFGQMFTAGSQGPTDQWNQRPRLDELSKDPDSLVS